MTTKQAYYSLLKRTISNWKDWDYDRNNAEMSFTARLDELRAYRKAWNDLDKPRKKASKTDIKRMETTLFKLGFERDEKAEKRLNKDRVYTFESGGE